MILLLSLAVSFPAAHAADWSEAPPSATVSGRLSWAENLVDRTISGKSNPGDADLAAAALLPLLATAEAPRARLALARLYGSLPGRPAWTDGYDRILAQPDDSVAIARAAALLRRPDTAPAARDRLEPLLDAKDPVVRARARAAWALSRAWSWSGGAEAVGDAVAAAKAAGIPLPEDAVLAAWILGRPELVGTSCRDGCPAALLERGEPFLALQALGDATDPASLATRARILEATATDAEVAAAWVAAADADPALRLRAVRALLDAGDSATAQARLSAADGAPWREAEAIAGLARATPEEELVASERALAAAPENPWIMGVRARALDAAAANGASLALWQALSARRPADRAVFGSLEGAAWAAGRPDALLDPLVRALARTRDPADWAAFASALANALAGAAGRPGAGDGASMARAAVALDPHRTGALAVAAGDAWKHGRLAEAAELYAQAMAENPGDRGLVDARVRLLCQMERWKEAREALAAAGVPQDSDTWQRVVLLEELASLAGGRSLEAPAASALVARVARYPDDAALQQRLGDALVASGRPDEAIAAYERARTLGGLGAWPALGLANAYTSRGQEGDRERALSLIETLLASPDTAIQERAEELQVRLEVTAERQAGASDRELFDAWAARLQQDTGSAVRARLGELYLAHWQYALAEQYFRSALTMPPVDHAAGIGLVRTLMAQGRFDEAAETMTSLGLGERPGAHGQPFVEELRARRALANLSIAAREGRYEEAESELAALRAQAPEDLELALMAGWFAIDAGRPSDALAIARDVLDRRPGEQSALGLALSAAWNADRLDEIVPIFEEEAARPDAPGWIRTEAAWLPTAARIQAARKTTDRKAARRALLGIEADDARSRTLLGGAWLDVGEPARARAAFAAALKDDPGNVDAIRGLAGSLSALGRPVAAERVLADGWVRTGDAGLAEALVQARVALGAPRSAAEALAALPATVPPPSTAPEPLPELPLAPATAAPAAPPVGTFAATRSEPPPESHRDALAKDVARLSSPADHVAATSIWRAGRAGQEQLQLFGIYAGHTDWLVDGIEWTVETWPMWMSDGDASNPVLSGAAGLLSATGRPFRWQAWAGWSWPAPGPVLPTGHLMGAWRHGRFEAALSASRTPATQTRFALAGGKEDGAWYGRESDNWLQATAGLADDAHGGIGILGRLGVLDGPSLEPLGWRQAVGWGQARFSFGRLVLEPGVDAQAHGHDRTAELFHPNEAGVYTPIFSGSVRGGLRLDYTPIDSIETCAAARAGWQWTRAQEWFLAPESSFIYTLGVGMAWAITPSWRATVLFDFDEAGRGWDSGGVQVALWHGAFGRGGPGPTATSSTHGIALQATNACASVLR